MGRETKNSLFFKHGPRLIKLFEWYLSIRTMFSKFPSFFQQSHQNVPYTDKPAHMVIFIEQSPF